MHFNARAVQTVFHHNCRADFIRQLRLIECGVLRSLLRPCGSELLHLQNRERFTPSKRSSSFLTFGAVSLSFVFPVQVASSPALSGEKPSTDTISAAAGDWCNTFNVWQCRFLFHLTKGTSSEFGYSRDCAVVNDCPRGSVDTIFHRCKALRDLFSDAGKSRLRTVLTAATARVRLLPQLATRR